MFGLAELSDIRPPRVDVYDRFVLPHTPAGEAARFFVLHMAQRDTHLRSWLGDANVTFLAEMRAIVRLEGDAWRSIVSVTWFDGKLILADSRAYNVVWGEGQEPFADLVMPPGGDSIGLVRVAPRGPRRLTLDLCCGPGTQTLAAAAYSERAIGIDLNPRALRFAAFNAAANRSDNVTFLHGDTYAPLGDERFDAILSNPPFVPWPDDGAPLLFRGGGPRGEDVLERILAGAVERLEPDGMLAIVADFADAQTLPDRIARWQGTERRTLLVLQRSYDLFDYAETHSAHLDDPAERRAEAVRLLEHFAAAGITTLDFGYLVQSATPGTARIVHSTAVRYGSITTSVADWFTHQERMTRPGIDDEPLALAPGVHLLVALARMADGTQAESYYIVPAPHLMLETRDVAAPLFIVLDQLTTAEVRLHDIVEPSVADGLRALLAVGYLRVRPTLR